MRIVVAPDKFKGSLEAPEVAAALAAGITTADPTTEVITLPVADGGEGTLDAALGAGFTAHPVTVTGPTGHPVHAAFARSGPTAVIEMALASGITALPKDHTGHPILDPGAATSHGTGELIRAALDTGATRIVLGVGGSACTDGGAGLLQALGARLTDTTGTELPPGGAALSELAHIDLTALDPRLDTTEVILAADVDHPLLGDRGAAAVFAPQKGATPAQVTALDAALTVLRDRLTDTLGDTAHHAAEAPGAGAAGGVGYAALAVLHATRRPGVEVVLELVDLPARLHGADLVITGEGSLDEQSLGGKTPLGVLATATAAGVPAIAVCGRTTLTPATLTTTGFLRTYPLTDLEPDPATCIRDAAALLHRTGTRITHDLPTLLHPTNTS